MYDYPRVRVTGAPGYEDFDGWHLWEAPADWPVQRDVIGFEIDGKRDFAVVPSECVKPHENA